MNIKENIKTGPSAAVESTQETKDEKKLCELADELEKKEKERNKEWEKSAHERNIAENKYEKGLITKEDINKAEEKYDEKVKELDERKKEERERCDKKTEEILKKIYKRYLEREEREIIEKAIDGDAVFKYATALNGVYFGVYADGTVGVGQNVGNEIEEDERPIARVKCVGISNEDSEYWTKGWATWTGDGDDYITADGKHHTLAGCIEECCLNGGDIENDKEELVEALYQDFLYQSKDEF